MVERISLTVFYLFVALLLYQGVVHRRPLTVFVGFGAYMLFTFAGNLAVRYAGRWTAEMVMLVMAAASGVYVLFQARRAKERGQRMKPGKRRHRRLRRPKGNKGRSNQ